MKDLAERQKESLPPGLRLPAPLGPLIWFNEVTPVLTQRDVVRNLIGAGSLVVIFGDTNSGKTFFTLDLCLHVASGQPWRGHRVTRGLVVYVAAEGGHGVRNRLTAYRREADWTKGASLAVLAQSVDLLNPMGDTARLIELVRAAESEAGEKVAVIALDTLARVMVGGDENSSEDMSVLVANADRPRGETGAAVLVLHHSGKDASRGTRGSSSLPAAVDTTICIEGREGTRLARVEKQRDLPAGQRFAFDLVPVEIGRDEEDGSPVTSCVVAAREAQPEAARGPSGKQQNAVLRLVQNETKAGRSIITTGELVRLARDIGVGKSSAHAAITGLTGAGFLVPTIGGLKLAEGIEP